MIFSSADVLPENIGALGFAEFKKKKVKVEAARLQEEGEKEERETVKGSRSGEKGKKQKKGG